MSYPVNIQALPGEVLQEVFTPENMRGRRSVSSLTQLAFPKSRSASWDGTPTGEKLRLQLCSRRKPRSVLAEKASRSAQRHARQSNKPRLQCFLSGSVSVNEDEEGVTVTSDRFDPGRDQAGGADRAPSASLPGDVSVPCAFSRSGPTPDAVVQSEAELHSCFQASQQAVSSRQASHSSQSSKIRAQVLCCQQPDAASFSLCWSAVCPAVPVDVQPVRAVPIVPTASSRSSTSIGRPAPHAGRQRGFLTMDQCRKSVSSSESDPKASSLPSVGLWSSGVTHVYNPQVWAWSSRFSFGSASQDRVSSETGCFSLVMFGSTHRAPQFFQCRASRPEQGPQSDFHSSTASQSVTLYQVAPVDGRASRCELDAEDHSRQAEVFRAAQSAFNRTPPPAVGSSVSDQDSGVEDEDVSPRPSPSPHPPAPQARRVQPSVPELSSLVDASFSSNHSGRRDSGSAHRLPPPAASSSASSSSSSAPKPAPAAPPHLHSTPNSNSQQPCSCCSAHAYNCTSIFPSPALLPPAAPPLTSSHHYAPKQPSTPPLPPPSSHQKTPSVNRHSAPLPHPSTRRPSTPPLPPASSRQQTPPSNRHSAPFPSSSLSSAPPPFSHKQTPPPPPSSHQPVSSPSHHPPLSPPCPHQHPAPPLPSFHPPSCSPSTPPVPQLPPAPVSAHHDAPPAPPWYGDSPSPRPSVSPSVLPRPVCGNPCCERVGGGGVLTSDTYQLSSQQDQQSRLSQAQVQMSSEAQGKLQSSTQQAETQTPKSTASVAVETGASSFWGQSPGRPHLQVEPEPGLPSPRSPPSSSASTSSRESSVHKPGEGGDARQAATCSSSDPHRTSGSQSPVSGESASMYGPPEEQHSFYQNSMAQLSSRLQESDGKQEAEEDSSRRRSSSASDRSSSSSSSSSERKKSPQGDAVVRATSRRSQQLGVSSEEEESTESDRSRIKAVETASTLASINPAAVVSRSSVSAPAASASFPGSSADSSSEANAIASRYLSQSQLSRLSSGGHAPQSVPVPAASGESSSSPSNMSSATRKYMRRYGSSEEEEDEEEEQEEVRVQEVRRPLTEKPLPQSQSIRDSRPKMQLSAGNPDPENKENRSDGRPAAFSTSSRQPEGSVGNISDSSRLRQSPKSF